MDHSIPIKPSNIHIFWEAFLKCNSIVGNELKNDFVSTYPHEIVPIIIFNVFLKTIGFFGWRNINNNFNYSLKIKFYCPI